MPCKRFLQHIFILLYVLITLNGAWISYKYSKPRLLPARLVHFSYGMMAPFQGYSIMNEDLLAEGQTEDEKWERIDLDPYYPMIRGNQMMYRRMRMFAWHGDNLLHTKYAELALLLQQQEAKQGRNYSRVRLHWQKWPKSSKGFEAMRKDDLIENEFLTQVP